MQRPAAEKRKKATAKRDPLVSFRFQEVDYQIDPERRQVYRNWVTVESARTFLIMSAWATTTR